VGLFSGTTPQLMLLDPVLVKEVLLKNFKSFTDNEFAGFVDEKSDPLIARNPFTLTGEAWRTRRNEISPAFTGTRVNCSDYFKINFLVLFFSDPSPSTTY
jgi:cytochrome P450 family 6/cytochrome P450 family 28